MELIKPQKKKIDIHRARGRGRCSPRAPPADARLGRAKQASVSAPVSCPSSSTTSLPRKQQGSAALHQRAQQQPDAHRAVSIGRSDRGSGAVVPAGSLPLPLRPCPKALSTIAAHALPASGRPIPPPFTILLCPPLFLSPRATTVIGPGIRPRRSRGDLRPTCCLSGREGWPDRAVQRHVWASTIARDAGSLLSPFLCISIHRPRTARGFSAS